MEEKLSADLEAAVKDLASAQLALFNAAEDVIHKKNILENRKAQALASGQITGKNAEEREANTRVMFQTEYRETEEAERLQRAARSRYDAAALQLDFIKTTIRILELPNA